MKITKRQLNDEIYVAFKRAILEQVDAQPEDNRYEKIKQLAELGKKIESQINNSLSHLNAFMNLGVKTEDTFEFKRAVAEIHRIQKLTTDYGMVITKAHETAEGGDSSTPTPPEPEAPVAEDQKMCAFCHTKPAKAGSKFCSTKCKDDHYDYAHKYGESKDDDDDAELINKAPGQGAKDWYEEEGPARKPYMRCKYCGKTQFQSPAMYAAHMAQHKEFNKRNDGRDIGESWSGGGKGGPIKVGDTVQDWGDQQYKVIAVGKYPQLKKYDSTGAGREAYEEDPSGTYVAVKGERWAGGDTYVFGTGDGGVEKVEPGKNASGTGAQKEAFSEKRAKELGSQMCAYCPHWMKDHDTEKCTICGKHCKSIKAQKESYGVILKDRITESVMTVDVKAPTLREAALAAGKKFPTFEIKHIIFKESAHKMKEDIPQPDGVGDMGSGIEMPPDKSELQETPKCLDKNGQEINVRDRVADEYWNPSKQNYEPSKETFRVEKIVSTDKIIVKDMQTGKTMSVNPKEVTRKGKTHVFESEK